MKNSQPFISVIMPAYNTEQYIGQAIESILQQTHKNLELLIINDCSTDRTGVIADSYAKKDKRVAVFHNKKNSRDWFCRNLGIEKSKGDYIAWMDSDDISMAERLQKQLSFLQKNKTIDMVGSYIKLIDKNNKDIKNHFYEKWFAPMLARPNVNQHGLDMMTIPANIIFKKSILAKLSKPYFRPMVLGSDMDILFRLMERNIQIVNMPNILYQYRLHDNQSTGDRNVLYLLLSLLRYAADCRRQLGFDPLDAIFEKYKLIDKKTMTPAFIDIFKIKKLPHHPDFIFNWLKQLQFDKESMALLFAFIKYQPMIFVKKFPLAIPYFIYGRMQFLHKPWNRFKKITGIKKKTS